MPNWRSDVEQLFKDEDDSLPALDQLGAWAEDDWEGVECQNHLLAVLTYRDEATDPSLVAPPAYVVGSHTLFPLLAHQSKTNTSLFDIDKQHSHG